MKIPVLQTYSIFNSYNLKRQEQNRKYAVYTDQIKKRFAYLFFSFICVFVCAYVNRVALIYSITKSYAFGMRTLRVISKDLTLSGKQKQSFCITSEVYRDENSRFCVPLSEDNTFWEKLEAKVKPYKKNWPYTNETFVAGNKSKAFVSQAEIACPYTSEACVTSQQNPSFCIPSYTNQACVTANKSQAFVRASPTSDGNELFFVHNIKDNSHSQDLEISPQVKLIFTDVQEAFSASLSICLFYSLLFLLPILLYHTLCFLLPGLFISQAQQLFLYVCLCIIGWLFLLWIVDFYLIPEILNFLYSFQITRNSLSLRAETKVYSYVSWRILVYLFFSVIFVVCILLVKWRQADIFQSLLYAQALLVHPPFRENSKSSAKTLFLQPIQKDIVCAYPSKACFLNYTRTQLSLSRANTKMIVSTLVQKTNPGEQKLCFCITSKAFVTPLHKLNLCNGVTKAKLLYERIFFYKDVSQPKFVQLKTKLLRKGQISIPSKSLLLYKPRRAETICFSLLVAAFICPPEPFTQLICTICMIACNELILAISFVRSYRFLSRVEENMF